MDLITLFILFLFCTLNTVKYPARHAREFKVKCDRGKIKKALKSHNYLRIDIDKDPKGIK